MEKHWDIPLADLRWRIDAVLHSERLARQDRSSRPPEGPDALPQEEVMLPQPLAAEWPSAQCLPQEQGFPSTHWLPETSEASAAQANSAGTQSQTQRSAVSLKELFGDNRNLRKPKTNNAAAAPALGDSRQSQQQKQQKVAV